MCVRAARCGQNVRQLNSSHVQLPRNDVISVGDSSVGFTWFKLASFVSDIIKKITNFIIRRQNATKYNRWHAGQRYIHHGTQAKHNQRQGLARANKLPNTTALSYWRSDQHTGHHSVSIYQMVLPERTSDNSSLLIYRPRKDERLSWPWPTCSGRFNHISGYPSDADRAQDTVGKFAGQRPTFYHCATQPTKT